MSDVYQQLFGRNIGNVSEQEQEKLRSATIAVAGTGGVGGAALFNLARIGVGNFKISDPETFTYSDANRQQGSGYSTAGSKKVDVMLTSLKAINPYVNIDTFPEGLRDDNIDKFLEKASIVIDGLDFFCLKMRKRLFDLARSRNLYVLSCPIFGFGTTLAVFSPDGPTFDEFFGPIPETIDTAYAINFGRSLFPVFPRYINLAAYIEAMKKGRPIPSFATSCALSGAVTAAEAVFILLNRRKPVCAPLIRHYDLFDAKITIRDSRSKRLNWFKKMIFKIALSRNKDMQAYKDFIDKL